MERLEMALRQMQIGGLPVWVEECEVAGGSAGRGGGGLIPTSANAAAAVAGELSAVDIEPTLAAVVKAVHAALAASKPDEASVELSLGIKGEVGVFIAKGEGNASIKVSAKWKFA